MDHESVRPVVKLTFAALTLVWGAALSIITIASLPYNPLSMSFGLEIGVRSLVPEGWGFFTRDPRGPDLSLSARVGNEWKPLDRLPIAHPGNLFGINRRPRAIPVELAVLLDQVDKSHWRETTHGGSTSAGLDVPVDVTNPMARPILCGPLRVLSREPVPWAWFAAGGHTEMPAWIVVLEVQCSHKPIDTSMS